VWVARNPDHARVAPKPTLASKAKVSVSYHRGGMDPAYVHDGLMPLNATDGFAPDFDFWPHKGTAEWIDYTWDAPTRVERVSVAWFDDTGTGECRLPASWRLLHRTDAGAWEPVRAKDPYAIRKSDSVAVGFEPVTTTALRLEIQLPDRFSAGLYEWHVE
ncbi:MAG: hypothetical protein JNL97_02395, partial [Verrucomicrobiales bacterium]|nr:hypothetical protein [Verrucomicrobiales bacterium]